MWCFSNRLLVPLEKSAAEQIRMSKRILVLGPSGSGKTYLSRRLAALLKVESIHLDAQFWKPGWVGTPQDQWRDTVAALVRKPAWVIDGMYESTLNLRVPAADTIIVLERSRLACLWGVCVRMLKHRGGRDRDDAPPRQKLDRAFLKYIWQYPTKTRPIMLQHLRDGAQNKTVVFFRTRKQVRRLLVFLENGRL
jgi:adenylate kinase family enzyme